MYVFLLHVRTCVREASFTVLHPIFVVLAGGDLKLYLCFSVYSPLINSCGHFYTWAALCTLYETLSLSCFPDHFINTRYSNLALLDCYQVS